MAIVNYLAAAAAIGILLSFQPLMNAVLARAVGSPCGAAAISLVVAGLGGILIGATLADHFGLFGLAARPLSLERAAGLALVLVGALRVRRG